MFLKCFTATGSLGSAYRQQYESVTIEMLCSVGAHRGQKLTLTYTFLGAFEKLRKAAISCAISVRLSVSVRPSVRMKQLGTHSTDLREILYFTIFRKYVEKIQLSLNPDKNNGYFTWKLMYIYDNTRRHVDHSSPSTDEAGLVWGLGFVI
jgi:hypothetical protein